MIYENNKKTDKNRLFIDLSVKNLNYFLKNSLQILQNML